MARYINIEDVTFKGVAVFDDNLELLVPLSEVRKALQMTPTADVVPKSDADEIAEELSDTIVMKDELFDEVIKLRGELANAKAKVAREIFEEIEELAKIYTFPVVKNGVVEIAKEPFWCIEPNDLAKLKKKYTGD